MIMKKQKKIKQQTLDAQSLEPAQIRIMDHLIMRDKETGLIVLNKRG